MAGILELPPTKQDELFESMDEYRELRAVDSRVAAAYLIDLRASFVDAAVMTELEFEEGIIEADLILGAVERGIKDIGMTVDYDRED